MFKRLKEWLLNNHDDVIATIVIVSITVAFVAMMYTVGRGF